MFHYRLNTPSSPSPVSTPDVSRPASEEKPDLYCLIPNMSCPRCSVGCGNLMNTLLVCGQYFHHSKQKLIKLEILLKISGGYDRTECLRSVEQYVPELNIWKTLPPMREARGRFQIAVISDKVYAIGGSNGTNELDSVEMLDLEVGKWTKSTKLPLAKSNAGVCAFNNQIYCVGGWNGQVGIKQCEVFNPENSEWSPIASLNTGKLHLC